MFWIFVSIVSAVAGILIVMAISPTFRDTVKTKWGAIGAVLIAILGWVMAWFSSAPPPDLPM